MKILKVDMEKIPKFIINVVKQLIKLGDSNGKYNNREYNCAHCFNINGILWYAKRKEKNAIVFNWLIQEFITLASIFVNIVMLIMMKNK